MLIRLRRWNAVCGLEVVGGKVARAAPMLKSWVGFPVSVALDGLRKLGWREDGE